MPEEPEKTVDQHIFDVARKNNPETHACIASTGKQVSDWTKSIWTQVLED